MAGVHLDRGLRDREDFGLVAHVDGGARVLLWLRTRVFHLVAVGFVLGLRVGPLEID